MTLRFLQSWLLRLALLLVTAGLFSCGPDQDAGAVRLELWTLALSPTFDDYMAQVIDDFEDEHPGVQVVWVDVPFDALDRKLVTAAAAGRSPDVVNFSDRQFARYASLGALHDLESILPDDPSATYLPGVLRIMKIDGELLGLPWYLTTQVRMINTDLLAEGGLSPDDLAGDWEGLQQQSELFHRTTGGFLLTLRLGEDSDLPIFMLQSGLVPFVQEGSRLRSDLSRPEVVAFVEGWVTLFRAGALPRSSATGGHQAAIEAYQAGELAMIQTGANMLARVRDVSPQVFGATVVLTPVTGTLGRSHVAVMPVGVMGKTRHPELAAELAWHLTAAMNQTELARRSSVLPSTPASLDDPFFAMPEGGLASLLEEPIAYARAMSARSLVDAVAFTPALAAWPDMRLAFNEGMKRILLGGEDVRAVLEAIDEQWDTLLATQPPATLDTIPRPEPRP